MSKEPKFLKAMRDKPREVVYRDHIQLEWVTSRLSFWERLKLLFGHRLVLLIWVMTEHRPGNFHAEVLSKISMHTSIDDYMREALYRKLSPIEQAAEPRKDK